MIKKQFTQIRFCLSLSVVVLFIGTQLLFSAPSRAASDAWIQVAKLTASDSLDFARTGLAMAMSGDGGTIVIGAPLNAGGGSFRGEAYVYTQPSGGWTDGVETAKLTASDGADLDQFGWTLGVSGDGSIVIAGAPRHGVEGAVYIFVRPPGGWVDGTETAKLTTSDGAANEWLGKAVAISLDGGTIVAGSDWSEPWNTDMGAVYVYDRPPGGWASGTETAKLTTSDHADLDMLGSAVAVSADGGTIVAGAQLKNEGGDERGAIYAYSRPLSGWADGVETAKLTASDVADEDWFGGAVAVNNAGDVIAAGAKHNAAGGYRRGAVYLFTRPPSGWANATETAKLTASDGRNQDKLGDAVSLDGDGMTVTSGATGHDLVQNEGAAYLFSQPPGGWVDGTESAKLSSTDGGEDDLFGQAVAISTDGNAVAASAPDNDAGGDRRGATYVFSTPEIVYYLPVIIHDP